MVRLFKRSLVIICGGPHAPDVSYGLLRKAIEDAREAGLLVTDEASAIEYLGLAPLMVQGADDNIKITYPRDLELAALFLERIVKEEKRDQ